MALTLEELEKQIRSSGGLFPLDAYSQIASGTDPLSRRAASVMGGGIPSVQLQGAPQVAAGEVLDVSGALPQSGLQTPNIPTGTSQPSGSRLDELMASAEDAGGGLGVSDLLGAINLDNLNLGNIDDITNAIVDQQYPGLPSNEKSQVGRLISDLIAAGQDPQFQAGYINAKKTRAELNKQKAIQYQQAKTASKDKIYGKLLDFVLRDDKDSGAKSKIVNVFRPDIIEGGGSVDQATQNARVRTTESGDEILEIVVGQNEDGSNIYEVAPAETVIINNPGQLNTLRQGAQGKIDNDDYNKSLQSSTRKVAAAGNILTPVNQMLDILQGVNTPADVANVTGSLINAIGRFKTNIDEASNKLLGTLDDDQKKVLNNTNKLFTNLGADNQTTSANGLESAVDENGDPIGFKWSELGSAVADNAVYKALFLELAYYSLLLKGQESRAVSDKDIINALRTIGGDASTPQAAMRTIINFAAKSFDANERESRAEGNIYKSRSYAKMREQLDLTPDVIEQEFKGAVSTFLDPNNVDHEEFKRFLNYAAQYGSSMNNVAGPYELYLLKYLQDTPPTKDTATPQPDPEEKSAEQIARDAFSAAGIKLGID